MIEWRDVVGYEGLYIVSNDGQVKSVERTVAVHTKNGTVYNRKIIGKILKQGENKDGYLVVSLCKYGTKRTLNIHQIVAEAFIGPKPDGKQIEVNHKDENRKNNRPENLEWIEHKDNMNYGNRAIKYSKSRGKAVLCVETQEVYFSMREAERRTGISEPCISRACRGKVKTAGGYHWAWA